MPERQTTSVTDVVPEGLAEPVRKSVRVRASADRAFQVFTSGMDSWWPRSHHIGKSPMKRIVVEDRVGGSIYTEQEDGSLCPWGGVLVWEPPHRFVMAWQITADWQYQPDRAQCSEVEVRFTPADDGTTLVELEHRNLERHGSGWPQVRASVDSSGGWGTLLKLFAEDMERAQS